MLKKKSQREITLRIWAIYYVLLIFRYIFFSSHEKAKFLSWNQENLILSLSDFPFKSFDLLGRGMDGLR